MNSPNAKEAIADRIVKVALFGRCDSNSVERTECLSLSHPRKLSPQIGDF